MYTNMDRCRFELMTARIRLARVPISQSSSVLTFQVLVCDDMLGMHGRLHLSAKHWFNALVTARLLESGTLTHSVKMVLDVYFVLF